jgi:ATP-dependent DNA ligase
MLGKFVCIWADATRQAKVTGKEKTFECGSGFDHEFAKYAWDHQYEYACKIATIEFREITKDGKPRFPVWKGLRHADDMGSP